MPRFTITFSGLNAFVFNRPLKKGTTPDQATFVIPNLLKSRTLQHETNGAPDLLDPHMPLLLFREQDRDAASTRWPDVMIHQAAGEGPPQTAGCLLFNAELVILADGLPLDGALGIRDAPPVPPGNEADPTLWWMATMDDAFPDKGSADPVLLQPGALNLDKIVARLPLKQGTLRTSLLTDVPCRFAAPGSPAFNQKMARELEFSVDFQHEITIEMSYRKQDNTTIERKLVLRNGGGDVAVQIVNTEVDDLLGMPKDYPANRPEADFEIFFNLIAGPKPKVLSHPALVKPPGVEGAPHGTCPPTALFVAAGAPG